MTAFRKLEAAHGLTVMFDAVPHWRIRWREADWCGPLGFMAHDESGWYLGGHAPTQSEAGGFKRKLDAAFRALNGSDDLGSYQGLEISWRPLRHPLRTTARAYAEAPILVFRVEAPQGLPKCATGNFAQPCVAWPTLRPAERSANGVPAGTRTYGHQCSEFALPVFGDAGATGFVLAPHRPPAVVPLLFIAPDGRTVLIAPLDNFHEQIIAVPSDTEGSAAGVRCGWHGDLASVPPGFASEMLVYAAAAPRAALEAWIEILRRRHGTKRPGRYADSGVGRLSYWTDNGAHYYYRTEPGCDYTTTLSRAVSDMHARDIPVRSVQLDSWFYPHRDLRPVGEEGAAVVPPSGMLLWQPREDLFPSGFATLRAACAGLPLIFHSRHFARQSPYFAAHPAWSDGDYAHPSGGELFDLLMAQAAEWGGITYEQDWMAESFLGVRGLREVPGRARQWQERLDRAAGEHGLTLQWCMATPADFLQTVTLQNLTSIRTSGDYRYLFDSGLNWLWFLHTNALARALGLNPFKDVFLSDRGSEPHAEVEALLASLSSGPVGIGDRIGAADREVVMRTCREDGLLIKPDVPVAAVDACFRVNSFFESAPLIGETYSQHPAGRWIYLVVLNAAQRRDTVHFRIDPPALGIAPGGPRLLLYRWREGSWIRLEPGVAWEGSLAFQEWDYAVLCPLLPGEITLFGDVHRYVTMGDRRIAHVAQDGEGTHFDVLGVAGTTVEVRGYAGAPPVQVSSWVPGCGTVLERDSRTDGGGWSWEESGLWTMRVRIGPIGHARITLR